MSVSPLTFSFQCRFKMLGLLPLLLAVIHSAASVDECYNKPCTCCRTQNCSPINNTCENGCIDGYTGDNCYTHCPVNCVNCWQNDREICDTCKDGYHNGYWHDEKTRGHWSENCSHKCRPLCKSCYRYRICKECVDGYFKNSTYEDCRIPCPPRCISCISGSDCIKCKPGFYGSSCSEYCGKGCDSATCNKRDGLCNCSENYIGSTCIECKKGKYGINCNLDCPVNCFSCNQSGICDSCKPGFSGIYCQDARGTARISENCTREQDCAVAHALCTGSPTTCQCRPTHYYKSGVKHTEGCLEKKAYGKHCNDMTNCRTTRAVCTGKPLVCTCGTGTYHNQTFDSCDFYKMSRSPEPGFQDSHKDNNAIEAALGSVFSLIFVGLAMATLFICWRRRKKKSKDYNLEMHGRKISHISGKLGNGSDYDEISVNLSKLPESTSYMNHYIETPDKKAYNLQSWNEIENEATYVTNTGYLGLGNLQAGSGEENVYGTSERSETESQFDDERSSTYSFAAEPVGRQEDVHSDSLEPTHKKINTQTEQDRNETDERYDVLDQIRKKTFLTKKGDNPANDYDKLQREPVTEASEVDSASLDDYEKLKRNFATEEDLISGEEYETLQSKDWTLDNGYEKPIRNGKNKQIL